MSKHSFANRIYCGEVTADEDKKMEFPDQSEKTYIMDDIQKLICTKSDNAKKSTGYAYGQICTKLFIKQPRYIRINNSAERDVFLYKLMIDHWKFEKPKLILSIDDQRKGSVALTHAENIHIKQCLIHVANTIPTWIFTNGFNSGFSKLIGEASMGHFSKYQHTSCKVIGISAWDTVFNRDGLENINLFHKIEKYNVKSGVCPLDEQILEPNHDAFILYDEIEKLKFGGELEFRKKFERYVAQTAGCEIIQLIIDVVEPKLNLDDNDPLKIDHHNVLIKISKDTEKDQEKKIFTWKLEKNVDLKDKDVDLKEKGVDLKKKINKTHLEKITQNLEKLIAEAVFSGSPSDDPNVIKDYIREFEWTLKFNLSDRASKLVFEMFLKENVGKDKETKLDLQHYVKRILKNDQWRFVELFLAYGQNFRLPNYMYSNGKNDDYDCFLEDLYFRHNWHESFKEFSIKNANGRSDIMGHVGKMIDELSAHIIVGKYDDEKENKNDNKAKEVKNDKKVKKDKKNKKGQKDKKAQDIQEIKKVKSYKIQDLFIWCILTGKWEMAKVFWRNGKDHMASALVASVICNSLKKTAVKEGNEDLQNQFGKLAKYFEDIAKNVLMEAYRIDKERAHILLVRRIKSWKKLTCMEIAVKGKLYSFLGSITYQMRLNYIWYGRMPMFTKNYRILTNLPLAVLTSWAMIFSTKYWCRQSSVIYYLLTTTYKDISIGTIFKYKNGSLMDYNLENEFKDEIKRACDVIKEDEAEYLKEMKIGSRNRIHQWIEKLKKGDKCYYVEGKETSSCTIDSVKKDDEKCSYTLKIGDKTVLKANLAQMRMTNDMENLKITQYYLLTSNDKDIPIGTIFGEKNGLLINMDTDYPYEYEITKAWDKIEEDEAKYLLDSKIYYRKGIHGYIKELTKDVKECEEDDMQGEEDVKEIIEDVKKVKEDVKCYYIEGEERYLCTIVKVVKCDNVYSYILKRRDNTILNANLAQIRLIIDDGILKDNDKKDLQEMRIENSKCPNKKHSDKNKCRYKEFNKTIKPVTEKIKLGKAVKFYFQAPKVKFALNIISYIFFLVVLSYVCLVELKPLTSVTSIAGRQMENLIYCYILAFLLEELRKIADSRYDTFEGRLRDWVSSRWSIFDIILYIIFIVAVILRHFPVDFVYARTMFSLTLSMFYIRFLQFYYVNKTIGPHVISVFKMMKDILFFLSLFVIAVLSYGTFAQALLFNNSILDGLLLKNIVYMPYWQSYGDLNLDYVEGTIPSQFTNISATPNAFVLVAFALYMLFSNVLLMNLLIAMFGKTFDKVGENSKNIWTLLRYKLSEEFYNRPVMPPPLNAIEIIVKIFRYRYYKVKSEKPFNAFRVILCSKMNKECSEFEAQCMEIYLINEKIVDDDKNSYSEY